MSLSGLLLQDITIYNRSSYDQYGKEVIGSGTDYKARVQELQRSVRLPNNETITIDAIVYLNGSPTVEVNDRVDYSGRQYKVFKKYQGIDGTGTAHHTKLELTKYVG